MINGEEIWTKTNSEAEQFSNVSIFAGDDWYEPQPGKIKRFRVKTLLDEIWRIKEIGIRHVISQFEKGIKILHESSLKQPMNKHR